MQKAATVAVAVAKRGTWKWNGSRRWINIISIIIVSNFFVIFFFFFLTAAAEESPPQILNNNVAAAAFVHHFITLFNPVDDDLHE